MGGGGLLPVVGTAGYGRDRSAGLVESLGGDGAPGEPVAVGDGSAEGAGDLDGAFGAVGEVVAVHAAQVGVLLLGFGGFARRGGAGGGGDRLVAAELVPGAGLGVGEFGVVAVPGGAAVVGVLGDLGHRRGDDEVLLGDGLHERFVEPVVDRVG